MRFAVADVHVWVLPEDEDDDDDRKGGRSFGGKRGGDREDRDNKRGGSRATARVAETSEASVSRRATSAVVSRETAEVARDFGGKRGSKAKLRHRLDDED